MTTTPTSSSAESDRQALAEALFDDPEIKQLEAAVSSTKIYKKAVDVIRERLDRGDLSDHMLLRIVGVG